MPREATLTGCCGVSGKAFDHNGEGSSLREKGVAGSRISAMLDPHPPAGKSRPTIPAPRTKGNREHRIPLCRPALEVLEEARALGP